MRKLITAILISLALFTGVEFIFAPKYMFLIVKKGTDIPGEMLKDAANEYFEITDENEYGVLEQFTMRM